MYDPAVWIELSTYSEYELYKEFKRKKGFELNFTVVCDIVSEILPYQVNPHLPILPTTVFYSHFVDLVR